MDEIPWKPCSCHPTSQDHQFDQNLFCENPRRLVLASRRGNIWSSDRALDLPKVCGRSYEDHQANPRPCRFVYSWAQGRQWKANWGRDHNTATKWRARKNYLDKA